MKNVFRMSSIGIFVIFIVSCSNSVSPEATHKFALYLLENDTLETEDIQELQVSKHDLRIDPIFDYSDLLGYNANTHTVYLNDELSSYLATDSLEVFSHLFGKPFVLTAGGERIYLGSFIPGYSSWAPNTPIIADYSVNNNDNSFIISGAPIFDDNSYIDVRNDERILSALKDKIIE